MVTQGEAPHITQMSYLSSKFFQQLPDSYQPHRGQVPSRSREPTV
jgi:hypothetical protein